MTSNLNVYQDGNKRNLMDWIREKGEAVYTDVGKRTWRVPPVKFNTQKLSEDKVNKKESGDQQSMRIEGRVLGQPNTTDKETNRAENNVCRAFESLSDHNVQMGCGSAMFLITNFEYDNYLNKLSHFVTENKCQEVTRKQTDNMNEESAAKCEHEQTQAQVVKLPKDVARRGELDILVLHQEAGVVLVQTKAVGYNFFNPSSQFEWCNSVQTAVEKAGEQLVRDRNVMLYIMEDLGLRSDQITAVVALPNLQRHILQQEMSSELKQKVCTEFHLDLDTNFLCEEDFQTDNCGFYATLERWWKHSLLKQAKGMDIQTMKEISYRTVGLLSTVSVWSYAQPRIEVRNLNEAAWETGNRYTQVVLSPQQVELLKHENQYMYLWGPAGSGKTLLLSLKGRQWLRRDWNVAILNTRLGSRGRTVGQVIETTINKTEGLKKMVTRIDLDLMDTEDVLSSIVYDHVKDQVFHFLLDEVAWVKETEKLLSLIKKLYPLSSIWCAGMLIECQPEDFDAGKLEVILRCPPSVQRVLRIVDNRDERCQLYKLDSAKAGLPTDGLPAFFIIHSKHGDPSIQPYDCPICARELSDFLIHHLNMKRTITNQNLTTQEISEIIRQDCSPSIYSKTITDQSECKGNESNQWGSSRGSDSGCDVEYKENTFDFEVVSADDKLPIPTQEKKIGNRKKKNKTNCGPDLVNNQDKRTIIETNSQDISVDCTPSSAARKSNKSGKADPKNSSAKQKPRSVKTSSRNQNCEDSQKPIQESSGKSDNCTKNLEDTKKLDQDKVNINEIPITNTKPHGPKKTKSSKGKSKHHNIIGTDSSVYPFLNFRDAVLPVTVPRAWHHYNKRGYWSISRGALAQEMVLLGSRSFCQELYTSGVPLKVEEAMVMNAEGKELENYFVMCPVGAVHGLEYKLVVCVPSACALPEYIEISQGIRHGTMEPKELMKRTQFGADYLARIDQLVQETCETNVPKIDKVRISTHVAEQDAPYDFLYEPLSESDLKMAPDKIQLCSEAAASEIHYVAPTYTDSEIMAIKNELCGYCGDKDKCVCQYFKSDELAAIHRLDAWNKAYVLMCASRCTSALVLVLP